MNARPILVALVFLAHGVGAATPAPDDYVRGITIDAASGLPLVEATLPDVVYSTVTRADLGDLRVFNADGAAIPHALCAAPPTIEQREVEPYWFMPETLASNAADTMLFDTDRLAPVRYARLRLPQDNSSVRVALHSRTDEHASWLERWSGESYVIVNQTERRESPPARFEPTSDRYWRVRIAMPAAAPRPTSLELGYLPARLRFLAQGPGPYTVAFGSRRAGTADPVPCEGLLADISAQDRERMVVQGQLGQLRDLGGEQALTPLPKRTPLRLIVLWTVLIAGVGLLVAMALALLRRLRSSEPAVAGNGPEKTGDGLE